MFKKLSKKSQQAMEFLLMHGWSLLITIIVGALILGMITAAVLYFKSSGNLP
jgi:uncharacterized protein (UPF0333 family)